jgi:2-methylcitrate dehydratase
VSAADPEGRIAGPAGPLLRSSGVGRLARSLLASYREDVPDDVLRRAALQTFDAVACAAGAQGADVVEIVRAVTEGSGPPDATVLFSRERRSVLDSVLVNGTAVRYLDYNDAFIGSGPGGHPSDNIVVALAVGERAGASGRDVLTAIALGYEVFWRFRRSVYARSDAGDPWDGVSVSAVVAAVMSGLLLGQDEETFTQTLSIGCAKGYALKQLRRGSISMIKGSANALVARDGILAAMLAGRGMTGPAEVLEGKSGMFRAFGVGPDALETLLAPPEWAIRNISIKPYPAIATSQAAVHAATLVAASDAFDAALVEEAIVRLPDSKATREHLGIEQRQRPDSRESADHSMPFLLAVALADGRLSIEQFHGERWLDPAITALMARVRVVPDPLLRIEGQRCYPAVLSVRMRDGRTVTESVMATPGSPDSPWDFAEIAAKFATVQNVGYRPADIDSIAEQCAGLAKAENLDAFLASVTPGRAREREEAS